jgi:type II secretory pathway component PulF
MLMAFSAFIKACGWWALPVAFVGTIIILIQAYKSPKGKAVLDELSLRIPVLGLLRLKIDTARFGRTLSALLGSGVEYGVSLDLTADVLSLAPLRRTLRNAREAVMEGTELSTALADARRFPPDVIAIVETGEETGKLPETLDKMADDYEEQVSIMVKNLSSLLQPLIVMVIAGIVLFIALAFFGFIAQIISDLSRGF